MVHCFGTAYIQVNDIIKITKPITMTWRTAFFFLLIVFIVVNCSKRSMQLTPDRTRTLKPNDITSFHPEITIKLGWVPYEDQKLIQTGKNEWKIVQHKPEDKAGKIPVLFVESPSAEEPILLDMNIENQLLGKLIKHSAITQQAIQRPFAKFFEEAKCQSCHPPEIKVDFGR